MDNAIIVGCGLTGSVIARYLADHNVNVEIWERRNHIGGNMYDYVDSYGILVHKYGPHTFHTNSKKLLDFMKKYGEFEDYHIICGAEIDGICTPSPFNFQTIDDFYSPEKAVELKEHIKQEFGDRKTATVVEVLECSDPIVRQYAEFLFEKDYSIYTAKQWGISAKEIDPSVLKRVPLRFSYDDGYFDDEYQVMPKKSYTDWFKNILDHKNITVKHNIEALEHISIVDGGLMLDGKKCEVPVFYTGALDELFKNCCGSLPYRSLRFEWVHEDIESKQSRPLVAYPQAEGYTRIVEFKKLPVQDVRGTTYEIEYPLPYDPAAKTEPYYPVLTKESMAAYEKYREMADKIPNLYCCGRLADFKYYNMDQALERALQVCGEIKL